MERKEKHGKEKTEAINYKEALSIQASLNDKKLGEVVERYNDFIERYEQFENNTAFSNLTFAEASLCAFDYAVNLDKEMKQEVLSKPI